MNEERERNKSRPKLHSLNINREIKGKEWNSITMWGGGRKVQFERGGVGIEFKALGAM